MADPDRCCGLRCGRVRVRQRGLLCAERSELECRDRRRCAEPVWWTGRDLFRSRAAGLRLVELDGRPRADDWRGHAGRADRRAERAALVAGRSLCAAVGRLFRRMAGSGILAAERGAGRRRGGCTLLLRANAVQGAAPAIAGHMGRACPGRGGDLGGPVGARLPAQGCPPPAGGRDLFRPARCAPGTGRCRPDCVARSFPEAEAPASGNQ